MSSLEGRLALHEVMEQAWRQVQTQVLEQLKRSIEGLLMAERDRRLGERLALTPPRLP